MIVNMSDHKKSLNKGNKVEIMSNVFSDHSGRNYKSKTETILQKNTKNVECKQHSI